MGPTGPEFLDLEFSAAGQWLSPRALSPGRYSLIAQGTCPFAVSGIPLVSAELLERRAALIELDPGYADVIVQRWRTLRPAEQVVRVRDGESVDLTR